MAGTIHTWINYLTQEFKHTFGIDLWKKYPAEQVGDLEDGVADKDGFKSRLTSLAALFDDLNKKAFDKATGGKTEGSRLSLIIYLKAELPNHHIQIDETFRMVNIVALLRSHLVHSGNPGYKEAIKFFGITEPLTDYAIAWAAIKLKFEIFLSEFGQLIASKNAISLKQTELETDAIETAFRYTLKRHSAYLKERPLARLMLREVAIHGQITDLELAYIVGHPVKMVREILLPFTESFLRVTYASDQSTNMHILKFRDELKNIEEWLSKKDES